MPAKPAKPAKPASRKTAVKAPKATAAPKKAPAPKAVPTAKAAPAPKAIAVAKTSAKAVPVRKPAPATSPKAPVQLAKVPVPKKSASRKKAPQPKKAPAPVRIFQIYYQPQQKPALDPAFEAYDNAGNNDPLLELGVFKRLAKHPELQAATHWGAVSWKFRQKTGMSGAELRAIIADKPGYDVYFCNPHPDTEALYHNLWLQGETSHPNFIPLCKDFFESAGLPTQFITALTPSAIFASANYFVATPAFWRDYLAFMDAVLAKAEKNMSKTARAILFSPTADAKGFHAGASYLPFIVERLFGIFLCTQGKTYRAHKFLLPKLEEGLNVHLKLLRQMKDVAHQQKSLWLGACWVNYRNLYLSQANNPAWIKKYLRTITPTNIAFG